MGVGGGAFVPPLLAPDDIAEDFDETSMLPSFSFVTPVGVTGELLMAAALGPAELVVGVLSPVPTPGRFAAFELEVRFGFLMLGVVTWTK